MRNQKVFDKKAAGPAMGSLKPLAQGNNVRGTKAEITGEDAELRRKVDARTEYLNSIKLKLS